MKRARILLIGGVFAAVVAGSSIAFALQSPTTSNAIFAPCHTTLKLVCLSRSASSRATTVHKGQVIELTLSGTGLTWTKPQVIGKQLLRQLGGAPFRNGERRESLLAVATGHTTLQSSATARCAAGQACPQFALLWRASIVIVP